MRNLDGTTRFSEIVHAATVALISAAAVAALVVGVIAVNRIKTGEGVTGGTITSYASDSSGRWSRIEVGGNEYRLDPGSLQDRNARDLNGTGIEVKVRYDRHVGFDEATSVSIGGY